MPFVTGSRALMYRSVTLKNLKYVVLVAAIKLRQCSSIPTLVLPAVPGPEQTNRNWHDNSETRHLGFSRY